MTKIAVKTIEPLEMVFADGTVRKALFNTEALTIFGQEFGDLDQYIVKELPVKPYDFAAKILYSGMKVLDKEITVDEAMYILMGGGEALMSEIANLLLDNFMATATVEQKEAFNNQIAIYNKQMAEVLQEKKKSSVE